MQASRLLYATKRIGTVWGRRFCSEGPKQKLTGAQFVKTSLHVIAWIGMGTALGWVAAEFMKPTEQKNVVTGVDELADPQARITDRVYIDISFNDAPLTDRIIIGLYGDVAPRTVKNFKTLCEGQLKSAKTGQQLSYQGSSFHRVIPGFMIQGGDFTKHDGTGGESIYGSPFADESFALKHTGLGVMSMANRGANTNTSQFFICTAPCSWLDGKHVVFGQVMHGMHVLRKIEAQGSRSGQPASKMTIVRCGVLPPLEDSVAANAPSTEDLDEEGRTRNRIMK